MRGNRPALEGLVFPKFLLFSFLSHKLTVSNVPHTYLQS